MSLTATGPARRWSTQDILGLLAFAAIVAAAAWYFTRDTALPVDRSAIGHRGLVQVVRADGGQISYATEFQQVIKGTVGLRVLPILDTELNADFERPEDDAAFLKTGTERDLQSRILRSKLNLIPTLLVVPKWTRGMRYSGYAHSSLLLPPNDVMEGIRRLKLVDGQLSRPEGPFLRFRAYDHKGLLYAPQLFPDQLDERCTPVISDPAGHLLIKCSMGRDTLPVWLLSDPDLINNHGLSLGENAQLAAAMLTRIAGDKPILIDPTDRIFTIAEREPRPARKWADLLRFFAWPLSVAWWALAGMTALLLWRSWVRFGPPRKVFDDQLSASRGESITAKARILRLAGNDPRLFQAHIENRLRRIERALFGTAGSADPIGRITALLKRTDPEQAAGFAAAAIAATTPGPQMTGVQLQALLEEFEFQAERTVHGSR